MGDPRLLHYTDDSAEEGSSSQSAKPLIGGMNDVWIETVAPEIDGGRFPIKRVPGERVVVEADVFAAGHFQLSVLLKFRSAKETQWSEIEMQPLGNDRWRGEFLVTELKDYFYTVEGWIDHFKTWQTDLRKRMAASQDIPMALRIGAQLVLAAADRAIGEDADKMRNWALELSAGNDATVSDRAHRALDPETLRVILRYPDRKRATVYTPELRVLVDPPLARTGAWYELFPRSCPGRKGEHGTFADVEAYLPRIAEMGFNVVYLPPIHPIGRRFRKGKNNNPECRPDEPGSPWAIGAAEGGHHAILSELGTLEDFRRMVWRARELNMEIALDIAYQCSPDHPWVQEHPQWFRHRPDGSIQYAENPPKKYEDIYPLDFETEDWEALWLALKSVIDYWIEQGVRVFRVDNPHTKSLAFWEWLLGAEHEEHPEVIFLAEAFTRPRVLYALAKLGFNQSYNYFPWRNSRHELVEYLTELSQPPVREYFRANLWPNTPDILPHLLQEGGRAAFIARLIAAATLGSSYGIYGPAYELQEHLPARDGGEEYLNSEKYEIRHWDIAASESLAWLISAVNHIRRENRALDDIRNLVFHPSDNDTLLAYSKATDGFDNVILVVVNLDWRYAQSGWVHLALDKLGLKANAPYEVHDLLTDARYQWHGEWNYVSLRPWDIPAHIFRVRQG